MSDDTILLETPRFNVVRRRYRTPDGAEHAREIILHPGAVTIVPLVAADKVCLIRNCRVAVGETLVELPAGTLEPGEEPLATARRELEEETGFRAGRLARLHAFYMSPGILHERMHLFVATDLVAGPARREAQEQIDNLVVSWEEALAMAADGRIQDAKSLVGLWCYDALRRQGGGPTGFSGC